MPEKQRYYRLGLFVIFTLAILFAILFVLGGRSLFQPKLIFETYFDTSVAGLDIGAPVKFRGVPLGTVIAISTSPALYESNVPIEKRKAYIVVRAEVTGSREQVEQWRKDLGIFVRHGLRAQTQLAGITGQQYLALNLVDPKTHPPLPFNWRPKYPYVPSAPSLTGELVGNVQKFLASLNDAQIQAIGQNLNKLVVTLDTKLGQLQAGELSAQATGFMKDARALVDRIDQMVAKAPIDQAVTSLSSAAARLDKLLAGPGLTRTVDNTAAFTARLRAAADSGELAAIIKNLDEAIQRVNAMLGDNQYDVRQMVQDLRVTAQNLRTLSEAAKRYPAGILIGGPPEKTKLPKKESR